MQSSLEKNNHHSAHLCINIQSAATKEKCWSAVLSRK